MAKLSTIKRAHLDPHRVSASGLAVLAGLSQWTTPLEMYLQKTGQLESDDTAGEAAYWGSRLEAMVLAEWASRNGEYVLGQDEYEAPCLFGPKGERFSAKATTYKAWVTPELEALITETVYHPTLPIMCHLDGIGLRSPGRLGGLLQAKTASVWKRDEWGEPGSDQMPAPYLLQVQTELLIMEAVTGLALRNDVPVLLGGQEYRQYTATLNPRVGDMIAALATDFVRRVKELDPPEPTYDEAGTRALRAMFGGDKDVPPMVAEPGTELYRAAEQATEAKKALGQAEKQFAAAAVQVQRLMGDATKVVAPFGGISWSAAGTRTTVSWKGVGEVLEAHDPGLFAAAVQKNTTTTQGSRSFRVTPKESNDDDE